MPRLSGALLPHTEDLGVELLSVEGETQGGAAFRIEAREDRGRGEHPGHGEGRPHHLLGHPVVHVGPGPEPVRLAAGGVHRGVELGPVVKDAGRRVERYRPEGPRRGTSTGMRVRWSEVEERARAVVAEYDGGVTLRQVWYRLISAGALPNRASMYRRLSSHLARARREGRFPDLVDAMREIHQPSAYADVGKLLAAVPDLFRLDRTAGQAEALWVCAEKDTLRVQLAGWLGPLGIPVLVVRGFASESYAALVRERAALDPRPARLLYVGDLDASGEAIERDWVDRTAGCWEVVERVALTVDQVNRYGLLPAVGKGTDPRWPAFAERHGLDPARPVQWEVEALEPADLRSLVMAAVRSHLDRERLREVLAEEARQREALAAFLATWRPPGGREV
ncbi:hypothetical protein ACFV2X_43095 [Streptomyces sp. NPDC059679]|uniref:hypothetical protein n=1 Tax=Streptomyces sp. NPDC059679 TaxID=3346903 RepID=UPI00368EC9F7